MDMSGEYMIAAPRQKVWEALNDAETLGACIPGCESVEKVGEDAFIGRAVIALGPVKAKFSGKVTLTDLDPPSSYRLVGEGTGGVAGFGKGGAVVTLTDAEGGATLLHYTAEAQVGGKLAQIGSRLIQSSAKKIADDFFAKFAARVAGDQAKV
jgi:carbon monoxide dehydrogenase subunit G